MCHAIYLVEGRKGAEGQWDWNLGEQWPDLRNKEIPACQGLLKYLDWEISGDAKYRIRLAPTGYPKRSRISLDDGSRNGLPGAKRPIRIRNRAWTGDLFVAHVSARPAARSPDFKRLQQSSRPDLASRPARLACLVTT